MSSAPSEKGGGSVSIEELEQLIRSAHAPPRVKKVRNETCIYYENTVVKCVPYNEELHMRLQEIASEVRSAFKGGGGRGQTSLPSASDVGLWLSVIKGRRPLVEHLVESLVWGQNIIIELGKDFMLIGLMVADVDFNKLDEFVYKFEKDPDALRKFILEKVVTLLATAKSSVDVAKCREDVTERDAIIAYLESEYENLYNSFVQLSDEVAKIRRKYNMIATLLKIATTIMPKDRLRAFANIATAIVLEQGGERAASAGGVV
jgi:hypothetical protein